MLPSLSWTTAGPEDSSPSVFNCPLKRRSVHATVLFIHSLFLAWSPFSVIFKRLHCDGSPLFWAFCHYCCYYVRLCVRWEKRLKINLPERSSWRVSSFTQWLFWSVWLLQYILKTGFELDVDFNCRVIQTQLIHVWHRDVKAGKTVARCCCCCENGLGEGRHGWTASQVRSEN